MSLAGIVSAIAGVRVISRILLDEMFTMVRMDLHTAHGVFAQNLRDVEKTVHFTSLRSLLFASVLPGGRPTPAQKDELRRIRVSEGLDVLDLLSPDGRLGGVRPDSPLLRSIAQDPRPLSGLLLLSREDLAKFGPDLPGRAAVPGVDSGLLLASVAPLRNREGRLLGFLFGARLLNNDVGLVDGIMNLLYRGLKRKGHDDGVVTFFLGDVRIATTLKDASGRRNVGTKGTPQALALPPTDESSRVERVDALGHWYITAHEPIRDWTGRPVGTMFVGVLESRYTEKRRQVILLFLGLVGAGMGAALLIGHWLAGRIVRPMQALTRAAGRLASGDLAARVGLPPGDEFGDLGAAFDGMAESLQRSEQKMKRDVNRRIAESERLAMVGQLAAGIAHEINNPLGGVLVYSHLLLDDTPEGDPRRSNLKKIAQETARCRDIVRSLLDFARQGELRVEDADLHALISQALDLAGTQKSFRDIRVLKRFSDAVPPLRLDRGKIQQVLLNVVFNAAEAMEGRAGALTVSTRLARRGAAVQVLIRDTGAGMPPAVLEKVFEPFFTTKEVGKGVGLGLSVSYGIVERHAGRLRIRSRPGKGTVVSILLPAGGKA